MYYGWEPLRDVSRPGSLKYAGFIQSYSEPSSDTSLTDLALERIRESHPDFVFLYMVETDEQGGHDCGWMSEGYLQVLSRAIDNVKRVVDACGDEYTIIITADHGGHDRTHGTELPEDMTIPNFYIGKMFEAGKRFDNGSLLDIIPTIAKIMDVPASPEWEGTPVI